MQLNLKRPIVFFDLETTGTNTSRDRIVEISVLKVFPNGDTESKTRKVNPGMPIPKQASEVHGIYDKDVENEPSFAELAKGIAAFFEGCDLGGYNCNNFDLPLLVEEFARVNVPIDFSDRKVVDVQVIFFKKEPRTLTGAYKYYCKKDLEGAHSAEADTMATYEVLLGQLEMYPDLQNDIDALDEYSTQKKRVDYAGYLIYNDEGKELITFGKYKGHLAEDVLKKDPGYYNWILNGDFPSHTKLAFMKINTRIH